MSISYLLEKEVYESRVQLISIFKALLGQPVQLKI